MADRRPPSQKSAAASSLPQESCFRHAAVNGATARPFETLWKASRLQHDKNVNRRLRDRLLYQRRSERINQIFIEPPSLCNIAPVTSGHQVALLTGRVSRTASGAPGCPFFCFAAVAPSHRVLLCPASQPHRIASLPTRDWLAVVLG